MDVAAGIPDDRPQENRGKKEGEDGDDSTGGSLVTLPPSYRAPRIARFMCYECGTDMFHTILYRDLRLASWLCKVCGHKYCTDCKESEMHQCAICKREVCKHHIIICEGVGDEYCGKAFCTLAGCCGSRVEETCIGCEARRQEMGYYDYNVVRDEEEEDMGYTSN